jgi:hypothetical protein
MARGRGVSTSPPQKTNCTANSPRSVALDLSSLLPLRNDRSNTNTWPRRTLAENIGKIASPTTNDGCKQNNGLTCGEKKKKKKKKKSFLKVIFMLTLIVPDFLETRIPIES